MAENPQSPEWSVQTKTVVVTVLLVIFAFLLVSFQGIIPPLLMAFIIAYLLYPVASVLETRFHVPWSLAVLVVFIVLIIALAGLVAWGGMEIGVQFQDAVGLVQTALDRIPILVRELPVESLQPGPMRSLLEQLDLSGLADQLVSAVEPTVGRVGSLIGTVATSAFNTIGWTFFIFLVSYFLLVESNGMREGIFRLDLRKYNADAHQMGIKLSRIWNSFLRGQLIIVALAVSIYTLVLNLYGIRYAFGLALLAGLARFMPYIGPAIFWIILGLVAFFQDYRLFELSPLAYVILNVGTSMFIDYTVDNVVYARVMADTLKVHPAAILVAIVIAAELFGLLGVLIAAPILATIQLFLSYTIRKLFNEPPWSAEDESPPPPPLREQVRAWMGRFSLPRKIR